MKQAEQIRAALRDVPAGRILMECGQRTCGAPSAAQIQAHTAGKGRIEQYAVFPGMEVSLNTFLADEITVQHRAEESVLELFYCRSGRAGWNMRGGTAVYLGQGDLTVHSMDCCADSVMMFPLGYFEGVSLTVDLEILSKRPPALLQEAGVQAEQLQTHFCAGGPTAIPASETLEHVFAPIYAAPPAQKPAMLKLKALELLLDLTTMHTERKPIPRYVSRQTELVREIHRQLTQHLDQRVTIAALSKQYLINTSTLKEVFKAVYGQPIAAYMKEYRVHRAMELLRGTNATVADIAAQVGYETQGKFTKAFKDVTQVLPTEYRKTGQIRA